MIKFNSYPPQSPDDVEFATGALDGIYEISTYRPRSSADVAIHAVGQSLGHTLLSAVGDSTRARALMVSLTEEIVVDDRHIGEQLLSGFARAHQRKIIGSGVSA